ncbi:MAG: hypothetical protein IPJ81_19485 [Chitinophagaceae bacterium]|nr:hypothetical protein [Chitinophagaceae bacterium]
MNTAINAGIQSAGFKKYDYKNIALNARLNNGNIESNGSVNDPNLQLNYSATANLQGKYPAIDATLILDTAQLYALNLYKDTVNASFMAYVKALSLDPKNLDMYALIDSSKINFKNKSYSLDTIALKANTSDGNNNLSFNSPIADIKANGNFEYDKLSASVMQYADKYYNITDTVIANGSPQQISFEGLIKEHPLVKDLVPALEYNNIDFKGSYTSAGEDSALNLSVNLPYLVYNTNSIRSGSINIATFNEAINAQVAFDTLNVNANRFFAAKITAKAMGDSLSVDVATQDDKKTDRYSLGATIVKNDEAYLFSLKNNLLLNYQKWNVANNNKITYSPDGILVNNFVLSSDSAIISAASKENILNSPINISIESFDIKNIAALANSDTLLASGIVNAKFSLSEFDKKLPAFTGNAEI